MARVAAADGMLNVQVGKGDSVRKIYKHGTARHQDGRAARKRDRSVRDGGLPGHGGKARSPENKGKDVDHTFEYGVESDTPTSSVCGQDEGCPPSIFLDAMPADGHRLDTDSRVQTRNKATEKRSAPAGGRLFTQKTLQKAKAEIKNTTHDKNVSPMVTLPSSTGSSVVTRQRCNAVLMHRAPHVDQAHTPLEARPCPLAEDRAPDVAPHVHPAHTPLEARPCPVAEDCVVEAMAEWQVIPFGQLRDDLMRSNTVKVADSGVHGLGLFNNTAADILPGTTLAILSHGAIRSEVGEEGVVEVTGGYQRWTPAVKNMPAWCAGGAANECTPTNHINACIKKRQCTRQSVTVLVACAVIHADEEIFTYYGHGGKWAHRGVQE